MEEKTSCYKVTWLLLFFTMVTFILGFSLPYWTAGRVDWVSATGLWMRAGGVSWMMATQAMACLGLIALVAVIGLMYCCDRKHYGPSRGAFITVAMTLFVAGICICISVAVFGLSYSPEWVKLNWAYYLFAVSAGFMFLTGIAAIVAGQQVARMENEEAGVTFSSSSGTANVR